MEKLLNFLKNSRNGKRILNILNGISIASLVIGLILSAPMFWLGNHFDGTWMDAVLPFFFYMFFVYAAFVIFLFIPYISHVAESKEYKGNSRSVIRLVAVTCSLLPGALMYKPVTQALMIPTGLHNIVGIFLFGLLYLAAVKAIFKKPFTIAQNFIPLD